eukprot:TRINITY_DN13393_c0_g1_i1.p1 TRINITY_DN13393_c0_g1~~TRINITY_DN13393_c0_g1_i1.p1  ORF type:complete len:1369 (+),score=194.23 TRINITY_DN13393_c0_g1_i1:519-4109(+)
MMKRAQPSRTQDHSSQQESPATPPPSQQFFRTQKETPQEQKPTRILIEIDSDSDHEDAPPTNTATKAPKDDGSETSSRSSAFIRKPLRRVLVPDSPDHRPEMTLDLCEVCRKSDHDEVLLLCELCNRAWHTFCLTPRLSKVPPGQWHCPVCIRNIFADLPSSFGFEESPEDFTLARFQRQADTLRRKIYGELDPQPAEIEAEFWRRTKLEEAFPVKYGADVHSAETGSAFPCVDNPTHSSMTGNPHYDEYIHSPWNLNNFPNDSKSLLRLITRSISGMKKPWLYVGMIFSSFCWHYEDHSTYSINYLHFGAPKVWYGIPGAAAAMFESVMRQTVPELFLENPDVLYHLVTLLDPSILVRHSVPVFRTEQGPGDFVVTFAKAYHAGFNSGFNLAEAVNFAPLEWLWWGRECVSLYSRFARDPVFCHEQLLCTVAENWDPKTDPRIAVELYEQLQHLAQREERLWQCRDLYSAILPADFERIHEDERQCFQCRTFLYLSALRCKCTGPDQHLCPSHMSAHSPLLPSATTRSPALFVCPCLPSARTLLVNHRLNLPRIKQLCERVGALQTITEFSTRVSSLLGRRDPPPSEAEVLSLLAEAVQLPSRSTEAASVPLQTIIRQISFLKTKVERTIHSLSGPNKLDINQVQALINEIRSFSAICTCHIPGTQVLERAALDYSNLCARVAEVLRHSTLQLPTQASLAELLKVYADCQNSPFPVDPARLQQLSSLLLLSKWTVSVESFLTEGRHASLANLRKQIIDGSGLLAREPLPEPRLFGALIGQLTAIEARAANVLTQIRRFFGLDVRTGTPSTYPSTEPRTLERLRELHASCMAQAVTLGAEEDRVRQLLEKAEANLQQTQQIIQSEFAPFRDKLPRVAELVRTGEGIEIIQLSNLLSALQRCNEWAKQVGVAFFGVPALPTQKLMVLQRCCSTRPSARLEEAKQRKSSQEVLCTVTGEPTLSTQECGLCGSWSCKCCSILTTSTNRSLCRECAPTQRPTLSLVKQLIVQAPLFKAGIRAELACIESLLQIAGKWREAAAPWVEMRFSHPGVNLTQAQLPVVVNLLRETDGIELQLPEAPLLSSWLYGSAIPTSSPPTKRIRVTVIVGHEPVGSKGTKTAEDKFCVCQLEYRADMSMVECRSCHLWLHASCMGVDPAVENFMCPRCLGRQEVKKDSPRYGVSLPFAESPVSESAAAHR